MSCPALSIGRLGSGGIPCDERKKTTITMLKPKPKQTLNILISKSKVRYLTKTNCGQHAMSGSFLAHHPSRPRHQSRQRSLGEISVKATLRAMSISEGTETRLHFLETPPLLTNASRCRGVMGRLYICVDFGSIVIWGFAPSTWSS